VRYVHGEGQPFWRAPSTLIGAGIVLALVVAVTLVVALSGDGARDEAATQLVTAREVLLEPMRRAGVATRLGDLRAAGRASAAAAGELNDPEAIVRQLSDRSVREPAAAVLSAERAYLTALGELDTVTEKVAAERPLRRWTTIKRTIVGTHRDLLAASAEAATLKLAVTNAFIDQTALESTLRGADAAVQSAHDQLVAYERRLSRYRTAQRRARSNAAVVERYRTTVNGILADYRSDRLRVDAWAERVRSQPRDEMQQARNDIEEFRADRRQTLRALDTVRSDAPASVLSAHEGLKSAVSESFDGLNDALSATADFESDSFDEYDSIADTPSWRRFGDRSESVDGTRDQTVGSWSVAVNAEIKRRAGIGIPKRPRKPRV
jgi:hypothetical protein